MPRGTPDWSESDEKVRAALPRQEPKPGSVGELQTQLDRFVAYYNDIRPHRALGRRTLSEAFAARPKATPAGPRLEIPPQFRVRRDKVDITGVVTLRHNSKLHHIGLGRRLVGTRVLVLVDGLRIRVLSEDGELIRELILDPTRAPASRASLRRGTMSRDTSARCLATSQSCPRQESNLRHAV